MFFRQKKGYRNFRVKSPVKSFRDLEVYKNTTQLAVSLFQFKPKGQSPNLEKEMEIAQNIAKLIPKMIAESYSDKFTDRPLSSRKLETAMRFITDIITKIDFLVASLKQQEEKEFLLALLRKYQYQRLKILNLKRAWERVFSK